MVCWGCSKLRKPKGQSKRCFWEVGMKVRRCLLHGSDLLAVASGSSRIIYKTVLLYKNHSLKGRMQMQCFLMLLFLHWNEEICCCMSSHTTSFSALSTTFHNGRGVLHPFPRLADTKDPKMNLLFPFFLQGTTLYEKKNTSKAILFLHTFQGSICNLYSSYPIT